MHRPEGAAGLPRRTFAIISHPDAGKTTLTEQLLHASGAIREAGAVAAKGDGKRSVSDWMSLEQERGISVASAAVQLVHGGHVLNLLDTPGHQDFSEDTYRTLTAADAAVMLLDAARGVQEQTEKLFAVCRRRGTPIVTFINKLDRPALDPLELLDEVERVLGIAAAPVTWPVGDGPDFQGVYERPTGHLHLFDRDHRRAGATLTTTGLDDPRLREAIGAGAHAKLASEIEFVETLLPPLDPAAFLAGEQTPTFFGSVLTTVGVAAFLRHFLDLAPPPGPLRTAQGTLTPDDERFSAFVFKLQANMDRQHRDRTAFVRIASGRFERGMHVVHGRTGRTLKLARAHAMFGQERATVDQARPGDVVGLVVPGALRIGDVLASEPGIRIPDFPRFAPETFATVRTRHADRSKPFRKGLAELAEEGVVQAFTPAQGARDPILGAVGQLQFDVFRHRMREEYDVEVEMTQEPHTVIRWLDREPTGLVRTAKLARDVDGQPVALFRNERLVDFFREAHPDVRLAATPDEGEVLRI
jgi:peptide chain release factor 3